MRHWWIGLTAVLLVAAAPAITRWQVQPASSAIGFSVSGGGQTAEGGFARYVARIRFDPDRLSQSNAIVAIDLGSVGTGPKALDETTRSKSAVRPLGEGGVRPGRYGWWAVQ